MSCVSSLLLHSLPAGVYAVQFVVPCQHYLQHVLFQDEVLAPILCDILLDCTPWRAVVIEACHTAVDFERWHVKQPSLQYTCLQGKTLKQCQQQDSDNHTLGLLLTTWARKASLLCSAELPAASSYFCMQSILFTSLLTTASHHGLVVEDALQPVQTFWAVSASAFRAFSC